MDSTHVALHIHRRVPDPPPCVLQRESFEQTPQSGDRGQQLLRLCTSYGGLLAGPPLAMACLARRTSVAL